MRYFLILLLVLTTLTAYRAWVVLHNGMPLYVDEAQYWYWAQSLDWGYYSKPPVIAAIIAATTGVCGDGEACVRAGSLIFYPLSTLILFLLARRLFDARTALVSAVLFITLPGVGLSSLLISTDVALFFCWTLALYAFVRALDSNAWPDWLLLGMALGLGMMSKYTMGVFFLSALLYVLWTGRWQTLRNGRAWTAVLLALVLFAPNLWWNWQRGFPTFQHTAEISHLSQAGLHWNSLGEFVLGQMGVFGLLFFPMLLWMLARPREIWQLPQATLLVSFTLPFLLLICLQALLGRANANWAAPTYVAGTLLLSVCLLNRQRWRLLVAGLVLNTLMFVGLYHFQGLTHLLGIELNARTDIYKRLKGWDMIGQQYLAIQARYPDALPLANERGILSELVYYARPQGLQMVSWNPTGLVRHHYDLVTTLADKQGRDFLYVMPESAGQPYEMQKSFAGMEVAGELIVAVHADFELRYRVWLLKGYQP